MFSPFYARVQANTPSGKLNTTWWGGATTLVLKAAAMNMLGLVLRRAVVRSEAGTLALRLLLRLSMTVMVGITITRTCSSTC